MSTTTLKYIATFFMFLDHLALFFPILPIWFHWLGRFSAPIFLYCIIMAIEYTKNFHKLIIRLYISNLIMSLCNLIISKYIISIENQITRNIFSTWFSVTLFLYIFFINNKNRLKKIYLYIIIQSVILLILFFENNINYNIIMILTSITGFPFLVEYKALFIILGILFFKAKNNKIVLAINYSIFCIVLVVLTGTGIVGKISVKIPLYTSLINNIFENFLGIPIWGTWDICIFSLHSILFNNYQWMMIGALPFLLRYNKKRGNYKKLFFYMFYPIHIYVLMFIRILLC